MFNELEETDSVGRGFRQIIEKKLFVIHLFVLQPVFKCISVLSKKL
jgi:hypothetical protein